MKINDDTEKYKNLIEKALKKDKSAISHLLSIFENRSPSIKKEKNKIFHLLKNRIPNFACIIGICGQPGVGKSTLIHHIISQFLEINNTIRIGIIAVDPTSPNSYGSILGDRTRMVFSNKQKERIFFRSQASKLEYGGLSPITFEAIRVLGFFYDIIIVETVGIGQNELDIADLSDMTSLIVSINHGDQIQFIKSGIMEVPDSFIIHKADDVKNARITYYQLKNTLEFLNYFRNSNKKYSSIPIFLTSATRKTGIDSIVQYFYKFFQNFSFQWENFFQKQMFFFLKDFEKEYGKLGLKILEKEKFHQYQSSSFEDLNEKAKKIIKKYIQFP